MANRCEITYYITIRTDSQLNSFPISYSRTFVMSPSKFYFHRQYAKYLFCGDEEAAAISQVIIIETRVIVGTTNECFCHYLTKLGRLVRGLKLYVLFPKQNVTKLFVCYYTNTMALEHNHNAANILITKTLMPTLQFFRLRC
jgi:hypothetical protein